MSEEIYKHEKNIALVPTDMEAHKTDNTDVPSMGDIPIDTDVKEAQIWAYYGAIGGVGVTSLAVQTAYELACNRQKTVCLIDLNFERGSCATYLDVPSSITIDELNASKNQMDKTLALAFLKKYTPNFSLIAAHNVLGGNDKISQEALLGLLDTACEMFDYIVLDIAPIWRPWTQAAIGAADKFAVLTEMTVPGLHRAKSISEQIKNALTMDVAPYIILNKFERRKLKHGLVLKDAQNVLQRTDISQICIDNETLLFCINGGLPAGKSKPSSRYVSSVRSHVNSWLGIAETVNVAKPSRMFHRKKRRA